MHHGHHPPFFTFQPKVLADTTGISPRPQIFFFLVHQVRENKFKAIEV
jgi:hypothetical protein